MSGRLVSIPNAIEWHDGMLLTPQHFDDLTLRLEGLLEHAASMAAPFNWGVSTLEVGEAELLDGFFTVKELEAVLPDGFPVWHDARTSAQLQLHLETLEPQFKLGVFTVYAALPAHRDSADRLWRFEPAEPTRQEQAQAETSETVPIPRLQPRLQLIASHTPLGSRYSSLPLAQLQYRGGTYTQVDSFVAPTQKLGLESPITRQCVSMLRRVREVAIVLQQQWRSLSAQERENQDLSRRTAVQQLVAMLPYAEALCEVGEVHPFQIFLALCTLAGHTASISSEPIPPNFAPYNHANLQGSFLQVLRFIEQALAENSSENYTGIPFQYGDDSFYLLFEPSWKGRKLVLALTGGEAPAADVLSWGEHALIGASILQDSMPDRRSLAARRVHGDREQGLFVRPGTLLFELFNDDEFVRGGEMFEVSSGQFGRTEGRPAEMMLFVMQA